MLLVFWLLCQGNSFKRDIGGHDQIWNLQKLVYLEL